MGKYTGKSRGKNPGGKNGLGRPKGRTATENTTLRLEPDLKQEVVRISKEEDRSLSSTLRLLIREAIKARQKKK